MQAMKPNAAMVLFDSLGSTARFYAQVMGLWLQYREVLPLSVLPVRYEDLVADLPGETRRILEFLDLPWDDAVLGYAEHAQTRTIATPSYHQVVQPIYRRSVGRWRNYADAFEDVLPILQPFIEAFGYANEPTWTETAASPPIAAKPAAPLAASDAPPSHRCRPAHKQEAGFRGPSGRSAAARSSAQPDGSSSRTPATAGRHRRRASPRGGQRPANAPQR